MSARAQSCRGRTKGKEILAVPGNEGGSVTRARGDMADLSGSSVSLIRVFCLPGCSAAFDFLLRMENEQDCAVVCMQSVNVLFCARSCLREIICTSGSADQYNRYACKLVKCDSCEYLYVWDVPSIYSIV